MAPLAPRLELQEIASLPYIDRGGLPYPDLLSFGFMNVTAEKIIRCARFNEVLDSHASGMQPFADPIEVGAVRRRVANHDRRLAFCKPAQSPRKLLFAVFPRRMEGRRAGVAESAKLDSAYFEQLVVDVAQAIFASKLSDLFHRFMVAGKHPHLGGFRLEDLTAAVEASLPAHQIARRHVVVGIAVDQPPQGPEIVVSIGEDQYPT